MIFSCSFSFFVEKKIRDLGGKVSGEICPMEDGARAFLFFWR
jgi:hypothetical protein